MVTLLLLLHQQLSHTLMLMLPPRLLPFLLRLSSIHTVPSIALNSALQQFLQLFSRRTPTHRYYYQAGRVAALPS